MKNKLLIMLPLCFMLVGGCSFLGTSEEIQAKEKQQKLYEVTDDEIYLWTDDETGVQYIIYDSYDEGGITPRLNSDGTVMVVGGGLND